MKRITTLKGMIGSNSLIRGSMIYMLGSFFLKGVSFILIPLYTKVFTPADYGKMELINTCMSLLMIAITFGFSQLIFIEYIHLQKTEKLVYVKKVNYSFNLLAVPLLIIGFGIFILFERTIVLENLYIILVVIAIVFLSFYQNNIYTILQLDQNPKMVTFNKAIIGIILLSLNVILIKYLKVGIIGVYLSNLIAIVISLVWLRFNLGNEQNYTGTVRTSRKEIISYLKFGFPFIITSLAYFGINGVDRFIIKSTLGEEQLGIYSLGFKFGAMLEPLLITPVLSAYNPFIFKKFSNGDFDQDIPMKVLYVLGSFSFIALVLPFFAKIIIDEQFYDSLILIPVFVMGFGFFFLSQMLAAPLLFFKNRKALLWNVVYASILNIIFNFLFIYIYGIIGSAIAYLATNFFWFLIIYYQARKYSITNQEVQ
jgi:O-antigen/teichoic acid export membrane protein